LILSVALTLAASIAAAAPVAADSPNFASRIDLPDGWQPEGITAGRGTTVYVGSLANGAIREIDVRTDSAIDDSSTLVAGAQGQVAVGVEFDKRGNRIWVAGGPTGDVRVYDARTGALLETYSFPGSTFLNDLVVTRRAVYVTDSGSRDLRVIRLGTGGVLLEPGTASQSLLTMTGFSLVAGQFNANGIVAKGSWLIVVNSFTGELFRVNPMTGQATEIDLGGASVTFGDGLELRGATLYVVRNQLNQVAVFKLRHGLTSATQIGTITSTGLDIPTTAAFQAGRLWVVNARFGTATDNKYWITRLPARPE
jgi:outer membrane protein assembly factor BamB